MRLIAIGVLAALSATAQLSHAATATCRGASGHVIGQHGPEHSNGRIDEADAMPGATYTISWQKAGKNGSVVTSGGASKSKFTYVATVVFESPDQVTLTAKNADTVWMYSIFPKTRILLVSQHNTDIVSEAHGGAVASSLLAKCSAPQ